MMDISMQIDEAPRVKEIGIPNTPVNCVGLKHLFAEFLEFRAVFRANRRKAVRSQSRQTCW